MTEYDDENLAQRFAVEPSPPAAEAAGAVEGDWRTKLNGSKAGTAAVLATALAVVGGGAWFVNRDKPSVDTAVGSGGAAATVQLEGDQSGPAPEVGKPAPGFTARTMDGRTVSLASLKGHPVWLTFGATWCTACRAEAPDIQEIWQQKKAEGVEVLAVFINEDAATVQGYQNRLGLQFPMISDPDTTLGSRYRSIGIPSHFFIDKDGILRESHVGGLTPQMMVDSLRKTGA